MCVELELVEEAQNVLADPNQVVCPICSHREGCAYLAQREAAPDIWFGANALLWHEMPAAMKGASLLVIDEAFALQGLDGPPILVNINDLLTPPVPRSRAMEADLVADLMPLRRKLVDALDGHPLGWLSREPLVAAGLTAIDCTEARKLEWRAKIEVVVTPNTTRRGLLTKFAAAKENSAVSRRALLWQCIEDLINDQAATVSGRVEIVEQPDKATGATYRASRLYRPRPIAKGWTTLPTIHLDATADIDLIRARVPHATLVADIVADEPHIRVVQYPSHSFGKGRLTTDIHLLTETWCAAVSYAQQIGGNWLIVMQKAAEGLIRGWLAKSGWSIPPFIDLAHHNALAGIDRYRDVRGIVVIGRTLPPPAEVERKAGVLTGRAVPSCGAWYPTKMVTLAAADGSMMTIDQDVHPDPHAEAVRRQICDDELMQIAGRGRGVNRGPSNPLEVVIFGNVVLPLPLDALRVWSPPTVDEELLACVAVTLSSSGDVAEAFGLNAGAVKKQRQRQHCQMGTIDYKEFLYGNVPVCTFSVGALRAATYRRAKVRHGTLRLIYDPRMVPDVKAWLIEHLGPLAEFHLVPAEAEASEADVVLGDHPASLDRGEDQKPTRPVTDTPVEQVFQENPLPQTAPVTTTAAETRPNTVFHRSLQLDLWFEMEAQARPGPLPEWTSGVAPSPIRQAILHELRRRGARHSDLAREVGLSRPQVTNLLRGRFGTSPANAGALRTLLDAWSAA